MALTFLDKLDDEQTANALKVVEAARAAGVSPYLALSVAFAESKLRQATKDGTVTSPKGALGLMQLMPNTAKELNVDPNDVDQNIKGGITYLKQLNDKFGDPMLAVAAYNHGPEGSFFTKNADLPSETKSYIKNIESYGGFAPYTPPASAEGAAEVTTAQPEAWKPTQPTGYGDVTKNLVTAGGGVLGAGVGLAKSAPSLMRDVTRDFVRDVVESGRAAAPATDLIPGRGPMTGEPVGGRMTGNWAASANMHPNEMLRSRSQKEAYELHKAAMAAEDKIRQMSGGSRYAYDPTRAHLLVNPEITPPKEPSFSPLQKYREVTARFPKTTNVVGGTLGGLGAAAMGQEAVERYQRGDPTGTALAGTASASGLATMLAPRALGAIAGPLGLGATGLLMLKDITERPEDTRELTEREIAQSQQPTYLDPYFIKGMQAKYNRQSGN